MCTEEEIFLIQELASHLKSTHVPQHHITNPLVVTFDVSIRASLPEETVLFSLASHRGLQWIVSHIQILKEHLTREPASGPTP